MKRQLLLLTFLFSCITLFAQRTGDATFYSNTGKKFYVVLNGVRQNTEAQTNVNISELKESYYSCRIIAVDNSFNLEKNIAVKKDTLITYRIIEKKGKYKLRYYTESPLGTAPSTQDQVNVVYHNTDLPESTANGRETTFNSNGSMNTSTNVSTSTTTTNTSTNQGGNRENVNISINLTENGMGADVNIQGNVTSKRNGSGGGSGGGNGDGKGPGNGTGTNGTTGNSSSTTTTSTSSTTTINGSTTHSEETTTVTNTNDNGVTTHSEETMSIGSEGNIYTDDDMVMTMDAGCGTSDQDIKDISTQIDNASFADDKMRVAKIVAQEKCMNVEQITTISQLFSFDDNKMDFIKAAYTNCMNQGDYYKLMEVFTFSDDKEELEKFIHSK